MDIGQLAHDIAGIAGFIALVWTAIQQKTKAPAKPRRPAGVDPAADAAELAAIRRRAGTEGPDIGRRARKEWDREQGKAK